MSLTNRLPLCALQSGPMVHVVHRGRLAPTRSPQVSAAQVNSFAALIVLRIGFAVAQAAQNPVCFGLIPELFPQHRTTAMAAYNSAIYMGRALSFGAVILAGQLGIPTGDIGITMVRNEE